jgi:hypothetical protein
MSTKLALPTNESSVRSASVTSGISLSCRAAAAAAAATRGSILPPLPPLPPVVCVKLHIDREIIIIIVVCKVAYEA